MLPPLMASLHAVATAQHHPHLGSGDVFAFGVAQGHTPAMLRKAFPSARLFGFDSFQGLPCSEDDVDSRLPAWSEPEAHTMHGTYTARPEAPMRLPCAYVQWPQRPVHVCVVQVEGKFRPQADASRA